MKNTCYKITVVIDFTYLMLAKENSLVFTIPIYTCKINSTSTGITEI